MRSCAAPFWGAVFLLFVCKHIVPITAVCCCACGGCSLGGGLACAAPLTPPPSPSPAAARPAWVGGDALLAVHPAQVRGVMGGGVVALERSRAHPHVHRSLPRARLLP